MKRKPVLLALAAGALLTFCSCATNAQMVKESPPAQSVSSASAAQSSEKEKAIQVLSEEEARNFFENYIVTYYKAVLAGQTWDQPDDLDVEYLIQYFAYNDFAERYSIPPESGSLFHVPAAEVENYVMRRFKVSAEYLKTADSYRAETQCYDLPFIDGLGMGPIAYLKIERKGDDYTVYTGDTDTNGAAQIYYQLTVTLQNNDCFFTSGKAYDPPVPI